MSTFNDLAQELGSLPEQVRGNWLGGKLQSTAQELSALRDGRNVLLYGSAFLQKPHLPQNNLMIMPEDINGVMSALHGMDWSKGLTLILHTPGGVTNAATSIVAYLRSKFPDNIEVMVPTYAMSAGTMISLAADQIWMGCHSQLGPIDPQMAMGGRSMSARAVVDQFAQARAEIVNNTAAAHVWAPVLGAIGPALLKEAENALAYSEEMVAGWLEQHMFRGQGDAAAKGREVAKRFNDAGTLKDHGRRIGREEASGWGVVTQALEDDQRIQEALLTSYHALTLLFEHTASTKIVMSSTGSFWIKNFETPEEQALRMQAEMRRQATQAAETSASDPVRSMNVDPVSSEGFSLS